MSRDFFDTTHENPDVEVTENKLERGEEVNLTAKHPTMKNVLIGMGWDLVGYGNDPIDLDVSCFLLDRNEKTRIDEDFIFYNNMEGCEGAVVHDGDSRTGAGEGDKETISIHLPGIPFDVLRLVFVISIYRGDEREQHLGKLRNSYIRILNKDTLQEIARYDFTKDCEGITETGMLAASLNREGPKWHFKALGEFVPGGLVKIATDYDIIVQGG